MARRLYLENRSVEEALSLWLKSLREAGALQTETEMIPVRESLGRVTARAVYAGRHSPHFLAAAMDGISLCADSTLGARESSPVRLVRDRDFSEVDTGDPLPEGHNAVVMAEDVVELDERTIELIRPAGPWEHVRPVGEDLVKTEMILPAGHRIRPYDIGGLLAGGVFSVPVYRKPKFVLIPTGSEIRRAEDPLEKGDLVEYNSAIFAALLSTWGAESVTADIVPDDLPAIREALLQAARKADGVIINAGSSAGREDYTHQAVADLGEVLVHGLNVKPGKPALLGRIGTVPVVGLPGYPVSATLDCELLVKPLVEAMVPSPLPGRPRVKAVISRRTPSTGGSREFLRVSAGRVGQTLVATPLARGAGVISSLIRADGLLVIPELSEGYQPGDEVTLELFRSPEEIERNVVAIGSHDLTLDLLGSVMGTLDPGRRLTSANTGSFGGLMALMRGEAHLAGIHLLEENTGDYNFSYVRKYLNPEDFVLMNLAYRSQGLIVLPGNPRGIGSIQDVAARGLSYVNRQKGSGTRILLDWMLSREGLDSGGISGYALEEYTHLGVATAVVSGRADCGLGVYGAARALELDFVPLAEERYDLCIRRDFYESAGFAVLKEALLSEVFRSRVEELGGYSLRDSGKMLME